MNNDIAAILLAHKNSGIYVDRIAGLVYPLERTVAGADYKSVKQIFPVSCTESPEACTDDAVYKSLVPDAKYRSIIYFEEFSEVQFLERDRHGLKYATELLLVCWFNTLRFVNGSRCNIGSLLASNIIGDLPFNYFNAAPYSQVHVTSVRQPIKSKDLFSKYTYNNELSQYLIYPFDFFALRIRVEFVLPLNCIELINITDDPNCV